MSKGLTMTIIFQAQSLNYGEKSANIFELKKITRGDGNLYTFASRQCLRYDIVRLGNILYDWNLQVVDKAKGTVQFKDKFTIKDSQEMDLFGYMKTSKKGDNDDKGGSLTRSAAVRLSNAISLEPYRSDLEYLNNKGLADRIGEYPNLVNIEQHLSFYTYTLTVDLDSVGKDNDIELEQEEKFKRVNQLLNIIKILNRNIRGRQENLSPLFVIGGVYDVANPFFMGRVKLIMKNGKTFIDISPIENTLQLKVLDKCVKDDTLVGIVDSIFENESDVKDILPQKVFSIEMYFKKIITFVEQYYNKV